MDQQKRQLVQEIVRQVIDILSERREDAGLLPTTPVPIQPPIGTCTGDYSKFPELRGGLGGAVKPPPSPTEPVPLSGIITANQLREAMDLALDGVAVIATTARLTPLANDLARQEPERVRRAAATAAASGRSVDGPLPWWWWIDGHCPAVDQVTQARGDRLVAASTRRQGSGLVQAVRDVASLLPGGRIAGALFFVHNAARAMCYANRCSCLRAVIGTCGEAVEQGISEMGANVLVIEYPHVGPRAMAAMVDRILQQMPTVPAQVQRELAEMARC